MGSWSDAPDYDTRRSRSPAQKRDYPSRRHDRTGSHSRRKPREDMSSEEERRDRRQHRRRHSASSEEGVPMRREHRRERSPHRERSRDGREGRHSKDVDRRRSHREEDSHRSSRKERSRSSPPKRRRRSYSRSKSPPRRSRGPLPSQNESFGQAGGELGPAAQVEKQKPNYASTGLLAKEANTVVGTGTVLKYHEPSEARKPPSSERWRMYIFKGKDMLDTVHICERSCWLMGRDQAICDLFLEHPTISKQHTVIQFRLMPKTNEYGDRIDTVKPYLIDLESANKTFLNGKVVQTSRFVELRDGDVIRFGESEREYVMMLPPP